MITVTGSIAIRTIEGRFGSFNVGTLDCSVGSFTVKDAAIEEFSEGTYQGTFVIDAIKLDSYISHGRAVTGIRAYIQAITILDCDATHPAPFEMEQDPLEEESQHAATPKQNLSEPVPPTDSTTEKPENPESEELNSSADNGQALFGLLWPLRSTVRLDSTVDRKRLREQKDYLSQLGYAFDARTQLWNKD